MALRKIINTEGISIVRTAIGDIENGTKQVSFSAYVKVVNISGNKNQITANVNFKGDAQEFNAQYQIPMSVEPGSTNFIAQVYEHLKSLEEFAGAIDC